MSVMSARAVTAVIVSNRSAEVRSSHWDRGVCPAAIDPEQLGHQQGFPDIKIWMACHFGGALLSGVVVCMIDSSAPQEPYLLPTPTSL